jgi:hypothetical protein
MLSDDAVDVTRRRLLGLASAVAIICRVSAVTAAPADCRPTAGDRTALVQSLLPNLADARRVGALYLSQTPSETDPDLLWVALFGAAGARDRARCRRILAARITDDFRSSNVLRLRGWVVARSEARLCALSCYG